MSTWGVDRNVPKTSYMWHLCRFPESTWMSHILEICDKNVTYIGNMWPYCYIFSIYVTFMSIRGIDINVTYMTFWAHFCQLPKLTWMSHICVYSTFIPRFPKRQQWRLFHVFITFVSNRKYPPCKGKRTSQGMRVLRRMFLQISDNENGPPVHGIVRRRGVSSGRGRSGSPP